MKYFKDAWIKYWWLYDFQNFVARELCQNSAVIAASCHITVETYEELESQATVLCIFCCKKQHTENVAWWIAFNPYIHSDYCKMHSVWQQNATQQQTAVLKSNPLKAELNEWHVGANCVCKITVILWWGQMKHLTYRVQVDRMLI